MAKKQTIDEKIADRKRDITKLKKEMTILKRLKKMQEEHGDLIDVDVLPEEKEKKPQA
jgi:hypothetical protein